MYCSNCGKELKDDAVFCDKCGTKVGESAPTKNITLWQDIKTLYHTLKPGIYVLLFVICVFFIVCGIIDLVSNGITADIGIDALCFLGGGLIIFYLFRTWKK